MNVDTVELWSNNVRICTLGLTSENQNSHFVIEEMDGTDADQITPRHYGHGLETGTPWSDLTLAPREITMRIGLNPDWTSGVLPSYLRETLYKAIASHRNGRVLVKFLYRGAAIGSIYGFVTKLTAPLFTKTPRVELTIFCRDPLIRSETRTSIDVVGLDTETLVLSDPVSTAPHGFVLVLKVLTWDAPTASFHIRDSALDYEWNFGFSDNYLVSDGMRLHLSSETNDKYFYSNFTDAETPTPHEYLIGYLDVGPTWPIMFPGENTFHVEVEHMTFEWRSISWYETHWGL